MHIWSRNTPCLNCNYSTQYTCTSSSVAGSLVALTNSFPATPIWQKGDICQNSPLLEQILRNQTLNIHRSQETDLHQANCRSQPQKLLCANSWLVNDSLIWFNLFLWAFIPLGYQITSGTTYQYTTANQSNCSTFEICVANTAMFWTARDK